MSLEMAHKVIVPQKKIMSRSFLNSGTLIVIHTVGMLFSYSFILEGGRGDIDPHINFMHIKFNQKSASLFFHGGFICKEIGKRTRCFLSVLQMEGKSL
jgi:hypothetical protein